MSSHATDPVKQEREIEAAPSDSPGDIGESGMSDDGYGDVAQCGKHAGRIASSHAGSILVKGHITNVVDLVLDGPVSANERGQLLRTGSLTRSTGNEVDDDSGCFPMSSDDALDTDDLGRGSEAISEIRRRNVPNPDAPPLASVMASVRRFYIRPFRVESVEEANKLASGAGLVAFDNQQEVAPPLPTSVQKRPLVCRASAVTMHPRKRSSSANCSTMLRAASDSPALVSTAVCAMTLPVSWEQAATSTTWSLPPIWLPRSVLPSMAMAPPSRQNPWLRIQAATMVSR